MRKHYLIRFSINFFNNCAPIPIAAAIVSSFTDTPNLDSTSTFTLKISNILFKILLLYLYEYISFAVVNESPM